MTGVHDPEPTRTSSEEQSRPTVSSTRTSSGPLARRRSTRSSRRWSRTRTASRWPPSWRRPGPTQTSTRWSRHSGRPSSHDDRPRRSPGQPTARRDFSRECLHVSRSAGPQARHRGSDLFDLSVASTRSAHTTRSAPFDRVREELPADEYVMVGNESKPMSRAHATRASCRSLRVGR